MFSTFCIWSQRKLGCYIGYYTPERNEMLPFWDNYGQNPLECTKNTINLRTDMQPEGCLVYTSRIRHSYICKIARGFFTKTFCNAIHGTSFHTLLTCLWNTGGSRGNGGDATSGKLQIQSKVRGCHQSTTVNPEERMGLTPLPFPSPLT